MNRNGSEGAEKKEAVVYYEYEYDMRLQPQSTPQLGVHACKANGAVREVQVLTDSPRPQWSSLEQPEWRRQQVSHHYGGKLKGLDQCVKDGEHRDNATHVVFYLELYREQIATAY